MPWSACCGNSQLRDGASGELAGFGLCDDACRIKRDRRSSLVQGYDSDNNRLRSESCPSSPTRSPRRQPTCRSEAGWHRVARFVRAGHADEPAHLLADGAELTFSYGNSENSKVRGGIHQSCRPCRATYVSTWVVSFEQMLKLAKSLHHLRTPQKYERRHRNALARKAGPIARGGIHQKISN